MSVIKAMRGESSMQFIETARRLELHAFSVCTKAPKRYAPLLTNRIFELASTVHEEVRAANNIYPHNQHEAQMRRDHLINANIALQNLSPKLTLLYDAILQNPEKSPRFGKLTTRGIKTSLREFFIGSSPVIVTVSANNWWERSPNSGNTNNFCNVNNNGNANNNNASNSNGVSFGLCNFA